MEAMVYKNRHWADDPVQRQDIRRGMGRQEIRWQ